MLASIHITRSRRELLQNNQTKQPNIKCTSQPVQARRELLFGKKKKQKRFAMLSCFQGCYKRSFCIHATIFSGIIFERQQHHGSELIRLRPSQTTLRAGVSVRAVRRRRTRAVGAGRGRASGLVSGRRGRTSASICARPGRDPAQRPPRRPTCVSSAVSAVGRRKRQPSAGGEKPCSRFLVVRACDVVTA